MATLSDILDEIKDVIDDDAAYPQPALIKRVNRALQAIAGGVRLPNRGDITPPLPDLYEIDTKDTVADQAWLELPSAYQRGLDHVSGASTWGVRAPRGGNFYSFALFMDRVSDKKLQEVGSVYLACVRGRRLYYQGIPSSPETLTLGFYRMPAVLGALTDKPEGLPGHMALPLLKHWVCADIFGDGIEDGENSSGTGMQFHRAQFQLYAEELFSFFPIDVKPFNVPGDEDVQTRR